MVKGTEKLVKFSEIKRSIVFIRKFIEGIPSAKIPIAKA